jgi:hypothetical protein
MRSVGRRESQSALNRNAKADLALRIGTRAVADSDHYGVLTGKNFRISQREGHLFAHTPLR